MADLYSRIASALDYPMLVVTADDGTERSGCLVGFSSQCSLRPWRYMVWISEKNHTHHVALRARHLGIHFLSRTERALAELFGGLTGDDADKFRRCRWEEGPEGVPVLTDCARWVVGRVLEHHHTGDHSAFLLEPVAGRCEEEWDGQLGFQQVRDVHPGHPA